MARKGSVVKTTMQDAFPHVSSNSGTAGIYNRNKPPFDQPHSTGSGGLDEKFFTEPFGVVAPATTLTMDTDPRKLRGKPR